MSFALASFFAFMALCTAAAPVTHLGGWLIKVLLYTVLLGLTLLIGNADMVRYAEAARVFSVLFLLSQVVIIVNLVYNMHEALVSRMMAQEERLARQGQHSGLLGNCWSNLYVLLCVGFIVASLTGCGLMYRYFGGNCPLNNFFISQTLVVGLTLCALSLVFPGTFGRGLLPPATIMAYNTYLTFSAITNNPDAQCNPSANAANQSQASIIAGLVIAVVSVTWTALSSAGSIHSAVTTEGGGAEVAAENPAAARAESYQGQGKGSRGAGSRGVEAGEEEEEEEKEARQRRAPGGAAGAAGAAAAAAASTTPTSRWVPFTFHVELFLAGCYVAMMASNWGNPGQQNSPSASANPELSQDSMWARMGTQFAIHILFIWTLIAPAVRGAADARPLVQPLPFWPPSSHTRARARTHTHTHHPRRSAPGATFPFAPEPLRASRRRALRPPPSWRPSALLPRPCQRPASPLRALFPHPTLAHSRYKNVPFFSLSLMSSLAWGAFYCPPLPWRT